MKSASSPNVTQFRGKVIPFPKKQSPPNPNRMGTVISQERLKRGLELLAEEARVIHAMRAYTLAMETDLAFGAQIEAGDLTFDTEVKVVRRKGHPGQLHEFPA